MNIFQINMQMNNIKTKLGLKLYFMLKKINVLHYKYVELKILVKVI